MKRALLLLLTLFAASMASAQDLQIFNQVIITNTVPGSGQVLLTQPSSGPITSVTVGSGLQISGGALQISGSGGVNGPNSSVDSDIALFNGTTGAIIKDSGTLLSSLVPTSRTVNGHTLSGNVTVTKSDVSLGSADNTADAAKAVLSATVLSPGRTINGVLFDGSTNITVSSPNQTLTIGTHLTGSAYDGTAPITIATDCASANTVSTLVCRDSSGNFAAGTITAALTGTASLATKFATARNINGVAFDGSANITVTADASTLTGTTLDSNVLASSLTSVGTLTGGATGAGFTVALSTSTITGTLAAARLPAAANFDTVCFDVANHDACLARDTTAAGSVKIANSTTAQRFYVYGTDTGTTSSSHRCSIVPTNSNGGYGIFRCDRADETSVDGLQLSGGIGIVMFVGAHRLFINTVGTNIRSDNCYGFSQVVSGPNIDTITAGLEFDAVGSVKAMANCNSTAGSLKTALFSSTASEVISSASTIAPTHSIFHVSGTTQVNTITVPSQCTATCTVDMIPDAAFATGTSGNISLGSTAVVNKVLHMTWDGTKWNPSY